HSLGILELREAIAEYYLNKYGVTVSPDQILVTSGTSPALFLICAALLDPGDNIILTDPHYACYPNFITLLEGVPLMVKVLEEEGFQYRVEAVQERITRQTKGIMINSPANPTGTLLSPEIMQQLATLSPYIIADEIYHGLVYEGKEHTILEFTDRAFVLNGFSKLFAMTGWRLGYVIAPPEFVRPMQKIQQNFFISAAAFVQRAAITALREAGPDTKRMIDEYNRRRQFMVARLKEIGFGISTDPTGAFYVFANAKRFDADSYRLAFRILEKAKVAVAPGIDFGANGEGYLRFSYANSLENIAEGLQRIERYLQEG
ncbi:MAG: pyridoxal phosphate-dependent aminotransferase, partial [Nitrospinota bacterium]